MTQEKNVQSTKSLYSFVQENCVYALPLLALILKKERRRKFIALQSSAIYDKFRVHMYKKRFCRKACSLDILINLKKNF